jgi:hypothetical protein
MCYGSRARAYVELVVFRRTDSAAYTVPFGEAGARDSPSREQRPPSQILSHWPVGHQVSRDSQRPASVPRTSVEDARNYRCLPPFPRYLLSAGDKDKVNQIWDLLPSGSRVYTPHPAASVTIHRPTDGRRDTRASGSLTKMESQIVLLQEASRNILRTQ